MARADQCKSITFLQPHLRYGGAESQTVLVANELVKRGYRCNIILHSEEGGLVSQLDRRVQLISLNAGGHGSLPIAAMRLARVLRNLEPSFVIVKLWSSILACAAVDGLARHHKFNYCEDLDPSDHARFIRFGRFKQGLIKLVFSNREHITANTHTVADSMMNVYGIVERPDVVSCTVDADLIVSLASQETSEPEPLSSGLTVVSVGSLVERKGLAVTAEALELLDRPVTWHVVGDGPLDSFLDGYRSSSGNVLVHRHAGTPNPYPFMKAADLLVHSALSEAFGIVILESIAAGTPVVASGAIGPQEMQKVLGRRDEFLELVPVNDSPALARVLRKRLDRPRPAHNEMIDYIKPYSLDAAIRLWVERAGLEEARS